MGRGRAQIGSAAGGDASAQRTNEGHRWLKRVERVLFSSGALLIGFVAFAYVDGVKASRDALEAFDLAAADPDQTLWSAKRRSDYETYAKADLTPTAVLRIPSISLTAPVFAGTDKISLNRGVGHVDGTESPGSRGNVAIAGHRDSFFRGLKDLSVGARMEVETLAGTDVYRVSEINIVDPLDTEVLDPTDEAVLTLITCYPFYYVGYAPDRYIVRGVLETSSPRRPADSSGEETAAPSSEVQAVARDAGPNPESNRL